MRKYSKMFLILLLCQLYIGVMACFSQNIDSEINRTTADTILAVWAAYNFVPINTPDAVQKVIEQIPIQEVVSITPEQKSKMYQTLSEYFLIYGIGDFERYRTLKMRLELADLPSENLVKYKEFLLLKGISENNMPTNHVEIAKLIWENIYDQAPWKGIAIEGLNVKVFDQKEPGRKLLDDIQPTMNAGIVTAHPLLWPKQNVDDLIRQKGKITCFDITFIVQHAGTDPAYPYYIRMYWEPVIGNWIPDQCVYLYSRERKYGFIY